MIKLTLLDSGRTVYLDPEIIGMILDNGRKGAMVFTYFGNLVVSESAEQVQNLKRFGAVDDN